MLGLTLPHVDCEHTPKVMTCVSWIDCHHLFFLAGKAVQLVQLVTDSFQRRLFSHSSLQLSHAERHLVGDAHVIEEKMAGWKLGRCGLQERTKAASMLEHGGKEKEKIRCSFTCPLSCS